jgi:hypothetical protein
LAAELAASLPGEPVEVVSGAFQDELHARSMVEHKFEHEKRMDPWEAARLL